jgi:hypothetical protein
MKLILNQVRKKIAYTRRFKKDLPVQRRHSDVYLVSYPASGVTWLCHILANINVEMSGIDRSVTFYNYDQFVPDIHISRDIYNLHTSYPGFRIIKSHSNFNPYYNNVIYLIRSPYDVMKSYYRFSKYHSNFKGNFIDFLRDKESGIESWVEHTQNWLTCPSLNLHLITYEGLRVDSINELSRLFNKLGLKINHDILKKAVELSSLENMKKSEQDFINDNPGYQHEFIGNGSISKEIDEEAKKLIFHTSKRVYEEVLYEKYNDDFSLK